MKYQSHKLISTYDRREAVETIISFITETPFLTEQTSTSAPLSPRLSHPIILIKGFDDKLYMGIKEEGE